MIQHGGTVEHFLSITDTENKPCDFFHNEIRSPNLIHMGDCTGRVIIGCLYHVDYSPICVVIKLCACVNEFG